MTTDLEQRLREALHEDAQRARLVNADRPVEPEARTLSDGPRRPALGLVAVAAVIALIVAGVAVIRNRENEPDVGTYSPLQEAFTDLTVGDAEVFTDIPPGSTVELPPAPISDRDFPTVVWSGTEMIVWGGVDAASGGAAFDDGAAFDLAAGTWRAIAPAPIEGRFAGPAAWTGTEMIVWGGQDNWNNGRLLTDGAAYDPTTDTWRLLPEAPIDLEGGAASVWTGDEFIVMGEVATQGEEFTELSNQMAAYNPATDEWRRLADAPEGINFFTPISTGETILAIVTTVNHTTGEDNPSLLARYDFNSDRWELIDDVQTGATVYPDLVPVTDANGATRAVLVEPVTNGAPIDVLDPTGERIGELPALPTDDASFGDESANGGVWAGEEMLFHTRAVEAQGELGPPVHWALNLEAQTWRPLGADEAPPILFDGLTLVADSGVLVGWGPLPSDEDGPSIGLVYRPPVPSATDVVHQPVAPAGQVDDRPSLPEPGEQPADPEAAEEEVRAAFPGLFDASVPREDRAQFVDRPEVWLPLNKALFESEWGVTLRDLHAVVDAVVFTSPTHASVRFQLLASGLGVPADYVIGDALLLDGRWVVDVTTPCSTAAATGITCDFTP